MPSFPRSLPRVCVALGLKTASDLGSAAEREYRDGNTFLEFRLDYLADIETGIELIGRFRAAHPEVLILATCRHREHEGAFRGTVERQLEILRDAASAGAGAVDLEIESAECARPELEAVRTLTPLIISYHNFENTPALGPVMRRLQRIPADAYKLATTARKPSDNLRIMDLARQHRRLRLIAFAMSDVGMPSRILAPFSGSEFTYAAPADSAGTAPGQIPAKVMRGLYRPDKLTKTSRIYGVIADPVAHSKSPLLHNRAFQARRIDAVYLPFLVSGPQLSDFMKFAQELPISGFSVTIPHKQKILRYLDIVDPLAKRIGAVNTVWRKGGKWRGANTDTQGVLKPLARHIRIPSASVLIAGYGGAARAAAVALADAGARVTITGRNLKSARELASAVKAETLPITEAEREHFDALVHATPVGMFPKPDVSIFNQKLPADVVLDMVYNPHETLLVKRAREQGCVVVYGSEMLLEQAACQFEIWTGEQAPRSAMQTALEAHN